MYIYIYKWFMPFWLVHNHSLPVSFPAGINMVINSKLRDLHGESWIITMFVHENKPADCIFFAAIIFGAIGFLLGSSAIRQRIGLRKNCQEFPVQKPIYKTFNFPVSMDVNRFFNSWFSKDFVWQRWKTFPWFFSGNSGWGEAALSQKIPWRMGLHLGPLVLHAQRLRSLLSLPEEPQGAVISVIRLGDLLVKDGWGRKWWFFMGI